MIDVGEKIILKAEYKLEGVLTDPSTPVLVAVVNRNGVQSQITATKVVDGVFQAEYIPLISGRHHYTFFSDDKSIAQGSFLANPVKAELTNP